MDLIFSFIGFLVFMVCVVVAAIIHNWFALALAIVGVIVFIVMLTICAIGRS